MLEFTSSHQVPGGVDLACLWTSVKMLQPVGPIFWFSASFTVHVSRQMQTVHLSQASCWDGVFHRSGRNGLLPWWTVSIVWALFTQKRTRCVGSKHLGEKLGWNKTALNTWFRVSQGGRQSLALLCETAWIKLARTELGRPPVCQSRLLWQDREECFHPGSSSADRRRAGAAACISRTCPWQQPRAREWTSTGRQRSLQRRASPGVRSPEGIFHWSVDESDRWAQWKRQTDAGNRLATNGNSTQV